MDNLQVRLNALSSCGYRFCSSCLDQSLTLVAVAKPAQLFSHAMLIFEHIIYPNC